ncbi:mechanosensitive ion channel family protein [Ruegeria sp. ANG-R]|uniref:mechanosensitive ion channel family protein n=1 Tax=Ruegeria sp. ANG-R TaxID=1577903 RepID=UPI0009E61B3E|nr:mechanosensitive ion channel family protein [Ruegeria sp. ANG-R]
MDQQTLISDLNTFLAKSYLGITFLEYLQACLIVALTLVISALVRPVLRRISRHHIGDTHARTGPVARAVMPPLRATPIILGVYFAAHVLHLKGQASDVAGLVLKSLLVAMIFWALARLGGNVDPALRRMNMVLDDAPKEWLRRSIQALITACGAAIILEMWNVPIAPLIGSLGVFGIAVGLAAKDLFSNLISGVLIMTEKRFRPGEWIKVDGVVEGTVERIDFRSTRIRRFDLSPVYVPNSLLADNAMTNFSRMTYRRINWMVGLEYGTAPDQLKEIREGVEHWLQNDRRICQPPEASLFVRIDSFGESSINLMIYCFTKTTVWADWLAIKEDFALAMIPIVKGAGSGFAFPARSVYLQQVDPPEIINPSE